MRLSRSILVLLVAVALVTAPAASAPRALGMVLHADQARVGRGEALPGATVFSGDVLTTTAEGTLRIRLATAQLYLLPNSAVGIDEAQGWHVAQLRQGGVGFSTTGDERVVVRTADVQIYPSSTQPTHAEVTFVRPNELLVTSVKGPLEVTVGSEVHAVAEATSYSVLLEQEPQEIEGVGKEAARRARVMQAITGVTISAAIITLILLKNAVSPSIP